MPHVVVMGPYVIRNASVEGVRVGEAEAGEIAGGEQARSERRLRGDVVAGLVLGRRRRRGVIRAADEGLQLQLRRALLHPRPSPQLEAS